jgi:hypothetical protein
MRSSVEAVGAASAAMGAAAACVLSSSCLFLRGAPDREALVVDAWKQALVFMITLCGATRVLAPTSTPYRRTTL